MVWVTIAWVPLFNWNLSLLGIGWLAIQTILYSFEIDPVSDQIRNEVLAQTTFCLNLSYLEMANLYILSKLKHSIENMHTLVHYHFQWNLHITPIVQLFINVPCRIRNEILAQLTFCWHLGNLPAPSTESTHFPTFMSNLTIGGNMEIQLRAVICQCVPMFN
jgi:hypothetical protein